MWQYLVKRSIITSIASYAFSFVEFFDFDNLMMKFMNISSQGDFDDIMYWISSYLTWVTCLFFWQLRHFLMYVLILCFIFENWQFCRKSCIVLITSKWFCNDSSWCFWMYSSILSFDICNFSWTIENCSWLFRIILSVVLTSQQFANKISLLLILNMLWSNISLDFMWCVRRLKAFTRSFSFFEIYWILNLYCSKSFDHRTCRRFNYLIIINYVKFLWFVLMISSSAPST